LPISHSLALGALFLALFWGSGAASARGESVSAKGILAHNGAAILFAEIRHCSAEPQLPAAQIFVSTDDGKSWSKRGPEIDGSEFEYAYKTGAALWIVGLHTAEGPGIDPFILVPAPSPFTWERHAIYDGPAELKAVRFGGRGHLSALVRHINVHDENGGGPIYRHESVDGGRSWKSEGRAKAALSSAGKNFAKITKRDSDWRIRDRADGGFDVQHRLGRQAAWRTMSEFPWQACDR
jgi:hypothetical protein